MKINPRQLEKMAKRMGINAVPVEASEVIIKSGEREIVISNPQVSRVNMMGQDTWQITGEASEREAANYSEEDIKTVANQTGTGLDAAENALKETGGDLAEAIMKLKEGSG